MLTKDPKPLGEAGKAMVKWWSSAEFVPPVLVDRQNNKFSAENPIDFVNCIAPHDYELAGRLPLQQAREILTELKGQMMGEGNSHG